MHLTTTVEEVKSLLSEYKSQGKTIGFTPTMGALHKGHLSLTNKSKSECDISVCSIFVNPTQFNEISDLKKYPRNLKKDAEFLKQSGLSVLFYPEVNEVYPPNNKKDFHFDFKGLDERMEGEFRPGHFRGVAQVVKRLLEIITPDRIYMGQKDFQQFTLVAFMIKKLKLNTKLVVCPIIRESDGLAMSSRNERLLPENRKKAKIIFETLNWAKKNFRSLKVSEIKAQAIERLSIKNFEPEYFEIINGATLNSLNYVGNCKYVVACCAVWAGNIRLIDNMIFHKV